MNEILASTPSAVPPRIEMPPLPPYQYAQHAPVEMLPPNYQQQTQQYQQQQGPSTPAYQPVQAQNAEPLAPVQPAYAASNESLLNSRDKLIAKAKAFKEGQDLKQKHEAPQQLSMNVDPNEQQSLEEARRIAREVLSSPFANQNLEVPAFIRRRQNAENQER
jgi:cell division protein FtsZ